MAINIQRRTRHGTKAHGIEEEPIASGDTRGSVAVSHADAAFFYPCFHHIRLGAVLKES